MLSSLRKCCTVCCLLGIHTWVSAQINLVPNPSFEEYLECPQGYPDLDGKCSLWSTFRCSPDYYHNCSSMNGYENVSGYQLPRTGEAYIGILNLFPLENSQEQAGVELIQPLEVGKRYYVSFYISSAHDNRVDLATNKLGARFTTYAYLDDCNSTPLANHCQVYTNQVITDTLNWIKVSGSFVADSAYRYIVIGGFFEDALLDTVVINYHATYPHVIYQSYYYVDDVCVSTDPEICHVSKHCEIVLPDAFTPNGDSKNDVYRIISDCHDWNEIIMHIYNRWGEKVFESHQITDGWDGTYNKELQPTGVYVVNVQAFNQNGAIKKTQQIQLIR